MFKKIAIVNLIMFIDLLILFFMLNNLTIFFVTKINLSLILKSNILIIALSKTILLNKIIIYNNNEFYNYLIVIIKTYSNLWNFFIKTINVLKKTINNNINNIKS